MFDLLGYLERHKEWSERTFGTHDRIRGLANHLISEAAEVAVEPNDAEEWVDAIIIAFDGLLNLGLHPSEITALLVAKQSRNFQRSWPKNVPADRPVEHVKAFEKLREEKAGFAGGTGTHGSMADQELLSLDALIKARALAHDSCDQDEVTRLTLRIEELKGRARDGALDKA